MSTEHNIGDEDHTIVMANPNKVCIASFGFLPEFNPKLNDWTIHEKRVSQFFIVNNITDGDIKRSLLLNTLTEEAYKLLGNLTVPAEPEDTSYDDIIKYLKEFYAPTRAIFAERYRFYSEKKKEEESLSEWAARCRSLSVHCNFGVHLSMVLRDKFIMGLPGGKVLDRLFAEEETTATFESVLELARKTETAQMGYGVHVPTAVHIKTESTEAAEIHRMGTVQRNRGGRSRNYQGSRPQWQRTGGNSRGAMDARNKANENPCKVCGRGNHISQYCRYREYSCDVCGVQGHLRNMCKNANASQPQNYHYLEEETQSTSLNVCYDFEKEVPLFVMQMNEKIEVNYSNKGSNLFATNVKLDPIIIKVRANNIEVNMELDCGSRESIISKQMYDNHFSYCDLLETTNIFRDYIGVQIQPVGKVCLEIVFANQKQSIPFFVVEGGGPPLLGRNFCYAFNLSIQVGSATQLHHTITEDKMLEQSIISKYPTVFSKELGTFNKFKVNLKLKEGTRPKFFKARPLPFSIKGQVEAELERLVEIGVLVPVQCSDWGTPIVPVSKENKKSIRICGDYKITLNAAIEVDRHPLPRIEELFSKMQGGITFSKIDLSNAYQQLVLDDESKCLTTISTHKGLFSYNRLPFGISSAPALFQRTMEQLLAGIEGVVCFIDDILITGGNQTEHLLRLEKVLNCLRDCNLTVKKEKCEFFQKSVSYLGYIIDKDGLHKSPDKIKAIRDAPIPKDVTQLKSFLGLITYYHKFVPNMPQIVHPLYKLIKKDSEWYWSEDCSKAFARIKQVMMSPLILVHYDPNLELNLSVDASGYGLGALLSHVYPNGEERPIAYASRTLNNAEKSYSQIDKEALAIVYGIKKFHQYVYGRSFNLLTDHKPLISIFGPKKGIPVMAANRLQRYALLLSAYDFNVKYVSSAKNRADFLSRLPINVADRETESYDCVNFMANDSNKLIDIEKVKIETINDPVLNQIYNYVKNGWPSTINDPSLKPYFTRKNEINLEGNILLWGYRVMIPQKLQRYVLSELHSSHLGIVKMKTLSRSYVWWPSLNKDIERIANNCEPCLKNRPDVPKTAIQSWPVPEGPWQRVHIDFAGPILNKMLLIVVDAFSKWLEVVIVPSITSDCTISKLREIFARFGLPKLLVSDNGRQLVSKEFEEFLALNGIKHVTSPPFHPSSNGAAENCVKTVKQFLLKEMDNNSKVDVKKSLCRFLILYRNTKHCSTGASPAEIMLGRPLRTRLDSLKMNHNIANVISNEEVQSNLRKAQMIQQQNVGGKTREFLNGQKVLVRDYRSAKPTWTRGKIVNQSGKNVYDVITFEENIKWKRHLDQLQPIDWDDDFSYIPSSVERKENESLAIENPVEEVVNLELPVETSRPQRCRKPPERLQLKF